MNRGAIARWLLLASAVLAHRLPAGPFPGYRDRGIELPQVVAWADRVVDYQPTPNVSDTPGFPEGTPPIPNDLPERALGPADGLTVSLGDLLEADVNAGVEPGSITVAFSRSLRDGPGADLAVFENAGLFFAADYNYAELALVEVSSNGVDFVRFPATSLNVLDDGNGMLDPDELDAPFGREFAGVDTTNIDNLAGVHPALVGTPFDLAELAGDPLVLSGRVDLQNIRYVRLVDVPGDGSTLDRGGRPIFDAWPTQQSGGFDLDGVGALHVVPEPKTWLLLAWLPARFRRRRPAER